MGMDPILGGLGHAPLEIDGMDGQKPKASARI